MNILDAGKCILALLLIGYAIENHAGECQDTNFDVWVVGKALQQEVKKDDLLDFARNSPEIDAVRFKRIEALIHDAYQYTPDSANAWYDDHILICTEDES